MFMTHFAIFSNKFDIHLYPYIIRVGYINKRHWLEQIDKHKTFFQYLSWKFHLAVELHCTEQEVVCLFVIKRNAFNIDVDDQKNCTSGLRPFQDLRCEISARVHALTNADPDPFVFDPLIPSVEQYLRQQHAQFVCSEEFLDAFNRFDDFTPKPPRLPYSSSSSSRKQRKNYGYQPTLTAEMLLKTQYERETTLGERYFGPVTLDQTHYLGLEAMYMLVFNETF